jgi:hypothetical protein
MEILKFSEPPKRSSRSASARKSGLMPMVTFGIAVLVLGGMSTTLAGTISLGSNNTVEFGQGVVNTAACDPTITTIPISDYDTATGFFVKSIQLRDIGVGIGDTTTAKTDVGCLGKTFTIRAFSATGPLNFRKIDDNAVTSTYVRVKIPTTMALAVANSTNFLATAENSVGPTVERSGVWTAITTTSGAGLAGEVLLSNFRLSPDVERITVESSS